MAILHSAIETTSRARPETRRSDLYSYFQQNPPINLDREEIEAHFHGMPLHYWDRATPQDIDWGMQTIHRFFQLVAEPSSPAITPVLDWKPSPDGQSTRVMICTWDRHGLLAKAAAAFSTVRINVLQADAFTRSDGVVLDIFRVGELDHTPVDSARLQKVLFLLEGALCDPPRFASFWACSGHKFLPHGSAPPPTITFDNSTSRDHTILHIEAADRLGLLCDILGTLANCDINIDQALVNTDEDLVRDCFFIRDRNGGRILDDTRVAMIRRLLTEALMI